MRTQTALLCLASILTLPAYAGQAITDEASLASAYIMTFYNEPNLTAGESTYCLTFTTDGSVSGYPRSGTYSDSAGDFVGSWYENGDEIIMSGYGSSGGDSLSFVGRVLGPSVSKVGGRFIDFFPSESSAELLSKGTFALIKTTNCATGGAKPHKGPIASATGAN
jgi:hypothetical protein